MQVYPPKGWVIAALAGGDRSWDVKVYFFVAPSNRHRGLFLQQTIYYLVTMRVFGITSCLHRRHLAGWEIT